MGGRVSTDFKSLKRIEISQLVQVLLNFEWFRGSPLWGGGGWMGWGWWEGASHPCAHVHTCMHAHAHAHVWHHREFPGIPPNGGGHLREIIMFTMCVCVHGCAWMCMHVHVCRGHPTTTPHPIHPHPHPQSRREPKTPKFNKSWTNRDNSILFEDSLPLNIPELI